MLNISCLGLVQMTKTKTILGISLAAAFAVSMMFAPSAIAMSEKALPGYRTIVSSDSSTDDQGEFFKATINTKQPIVHNGQKGAYGFGIFIEDASAVLALTTHMCASDTLVQGNAPDARCPDTIGLLDLLTGSSGVNAVHDDATFHAHMLVLTEDLDLDQLGIETDCSSDSDTFAKVNLLDSVLYNNDRQDAAFDILSPDWPVSVVGKSITVGNVPVDKALDGNSDVSGVVSYGITPEWNNDGTITALCLTYPLSED